MVVGTNGAELNDVAAGENAQATLRVAALKPVGVDATEVVEEFALDL